MTKKEKLLEYIAQPKLTDARNSMGCSENWYNSYFAIAKTFSHEEIQEMPDSEIENLVKLGDAIAEGLW